MKTYIKVQRMSRFSFIIFINLLTNIIIGCGSKNEDDKNAVQTKKNVNTKIKHLEVINSKQNLKDKPIKNEIIKLKTETKNFNQTKKKSSKASKKNPLIFFNNKLVKRNNNLIEKALVNNHKQRISGKNIDNNFRRNIPNTKSKNKSNLIFSKNRFFNRNNKQKSNSIFNSNKLRRNNANQYPMYNKNMLPINQNRFRFNPFNRKIFNDRNVLKSQNNLGGNNNINGMKVFRMNNSSSSDSQKRNDKLQNMPLNQRNNNQNINKIRNFKFRKYFKNLNKKQDNKDDKNKHLEKEDLKNKLVGIPIIEIEEGNNLLKNNLSEEDKDKIKKEKQITKMILWLNSKKAWQKKDFEFLTENLKFYGNIVKKEIDNKIDGKHKKLNKELNTILKKYFKIINKIKNKKFKTKKEFCYIATLYNGLCGFISKLNMIFNNIRQLDRDICKNDVLIQEGVWDEIYRIKDDLKYAMNLLSKQSKMYDKFKIFGSIKNKDLINLDHNFMSSYKDRLEKIKFNIQYLKIKIENKCNNREEAPDINKDIYSIARLICQLIIEKQIAKFISASIFRIESFVNIRYEYSKSYLKIRKLYSEIMNLRNELIIKINNIN
ncbi:MAG: hypothetical protein GY830_05105 [Bacteroidetes bacterium]|nr:hypothetical protein [Bacteroidota bacterium]